MTYLRSETILPDGNCFVGHFEHLVTAASREIERFTGKRLQYDKTVSSKGAVIMRTAKELLA